MNRTKIIEQLEKFMSKNGLSAYQVADLAGVSRATVYAFLGGGDIKLDTATKLLSVCAKNKAWVLQNVNKEDQ